MSVRGSKFKRHAKYHIIDVKQPPILTNNYLISCYRCNTLFIACVVNMPYGKVRCVHCRKENKLMNPKYFKLLAHQWNDTEIRSFNMKRSMFSKVDMLKIKGERK